MRDGSRVYSDEAADLIIEALSRGTTLTAACRAPGMPCKDAVYDWIENDLNGFGPRFARARAQGFDAIADDCIAIAEDGSRDTYTYEGRDGEEITKTDMEVVLRSKLRIETRLKLLSKWDPKRYGERVELRHGDPNGNALAPATISLTIAKAPEGE